MLTNFLLEAGCEDHSFWTRQLKTISMVLIPSSLSLLTPGQNASFDEADNVPSSASSGFLYLVCTITDISRLQLVPCNKSHKLWYQARALVLHVLEGGKVSASKLIHCFSSHTAAFGFWATLPPDIITLNPAKKKTDQSLYGFQTGIVIAAHATLDTEQLIFIWELPLLIQLPFYRVLMVSYYNLQSTWIHDILDSTVSK